MQVEVWSDIACPFCYIGKRRLEAGLEQFAHKDHVQIVYKSFQLNKNARKDITYNAYDALSARSGMSWEEAKEIHERLAKQAEADGLDLRFDTLQLTNTLDAHRLLHFAEQHGKNNEVAELLFKAYFTECKHVGIHETLIAIAAEEGLDPKATAKMLISDQFTDEVRADHLKGESIGVSGVPFYVIDRKYAISGAQPANVFLKALETAWGESQPLTVLNPTSVEVVPVCENGICKNK
ncbi:DsbA family oxidoreductase [Psychrobacillus glaciei]|uniref:DsbA family oxidoreductase n=1 Tax=Psychrobacillus glaciei TaxID=2283160 RepID=A0A5J6SMI9_9BACI|nr:DsbA family oxidoreductase [Psychrobacillus glaciei]QFF99230.1 DsbA family oxidoreductase [Psychrobacillus glaciei]